MFRKLSEIKYDKYVLKIHACTQSGTSGGADLPQTTCLRRLSQHIDDLRSMDFFGSVMAYDKVVSAQRIFYSNC